MKMSRALVIQKTKAARDEAIYERARIAKEWRRELKEWRSKTIKSAEGDLKEFKAKLKGLDLDAASLDVNSFPKLHWSSQPPYTGMMEERNLERKIFYLERMLTQLDMVSGDSIPVHGGVFKDLLGMIT